MTKFGWKDKTEYIAHGVPETDFKPLPEALITDLRKTHLGEGHQDSFVIFYNSRNAMRKRTGNVLVAFKLFLDTLTPAQQAKVVLCMNTPPKDPEGQDLFRIIDDFGMSGKVAIHDGKVGNDRINEFYNISDVTISLSSEEGFGLSILESLMTGTPVVCTKTGGMQDQGLDPDSGEEFGMVLTPEARSLIGSQQTPYIWSHHLDPQTAADALRKLYDSKQADPATYKEKWAGSRAIASVRRRFNLSEIQQRWEAVIVREIEKFRIRKAAGRSVRCVEI